MPEKRQQCHPCRGVGRVADPDHNQGQKCGSCGGSGVQFVVVDKATGVYRLEPGELPLGELHSECPSCQGFGVVQDAQHGQSQKCGRCSGRGLIYRKLCEVHQCQRRAMPDRKICEVHAFPAARPPETTGRRAAVLATKKKLAEEAKVSDGMTDATEEETNP